MEEKAYKAGFIQQKTQCVELLRVVRGVEKLIDPLQLPSGSFSAASPLPWMLQEWGGARTKCVGLFWCAGRTSGFTALPTHLPGWDVRLTWVQLLALQFASREKAGVG